jgi:hypothetical protein
MMADEKVKLTVRLPAELHLALKERAAEYHISLNQAVVDTLAAELVVSPPADETETERFDRMMRKSGLLADTSWMSDLAQELLNGEEPPSLEEVREWLAGIPLSDWIIEDRGPR